MPRHCIEGRLMARSLPLWWLFAVGLACWATIAMGQEPAREAPPRVSEPILRPPAGPQEILERYGIGPSQLEGFFNGQPLMPSEEDVLVKILFRLPRMGLDNLQRWRQTNVSWDQLAATPAEHRVQVFHVRGRVKRVERQALLPEQAALYELEHFYRVTLDIADAPYRALLLARRVPAAWKLDEPLDEPAAADALFLKLGDSAADSPPLIFAAGRVAWLPDRPSAEHHIGSPQLQLAKLGMDAGLWELVRGVNGRGLGDEDREAFYQLLAAVGRPEASAIVSAEAKPLALVPLLEHPEQHHGEVHLVEGLARRVMKVPVRDADVRARFGIDHYYEIDLFLPLGNTSIRIGKDATGQKSPVYRNDFPATLVVRQLPPGMAEGERVHQTVRAKAVFFKLWVYPSPFAEKFNQVQPAPLLVAAEPTVVPFEAASNWVVSTLVLAAFVLALGVVAIITWWQRSSDRHDKVRKAAHGSDAPPDFSGLG
jgi:hypothetical protein